MFHTIYCQITSGDDDERLRGWQDLHVHSTILRDATDRQLQLLFKSLAREPKMEVLRAGILALLCALFRNQTGNGAADPTCTAHPVEGDLLLDWLWSPFKLTSVVFSTRNLSHQRRDEGAEFQLSRLLCEHLYPKLKFEPLLWKNGATDWQRQLCSKPFEAVCLLGRLGLYGEEAIKQLVNPRARFSFPVSRRPADLEDEAAMEDYRCIRELCDDGTVEHWATRDINGRRTDFAIVQRHTVRFNSRKIAVIICAGGSSLGTLAASRWATQELARSTHFATSSKIPTPAGASADSCMEALLQTTAKTTTHEWEPESIDLKKLYLDGWEWQQDERAWRRMRIHQITIQCDGDRPVRVLFDGKHHKKIQTSGKSFQLLVALARLKDKTKRSEIDCAQLARATNFGQDPDELIRMQSALDTLKHRHLPTSLTVRPTVKLHPRVAFEPITRGVRRR